MDQFVRLIQKRGAGVPTIPPSTDHRNGDWLETDIYEGETYQDTDTGLMYTRNGSDIVEIKSGLIYEEVDLTSTELFALNSSPTTLKAALGTDQYYEPECITLEFSFGTTAYALTDNILIVMGGKNLAEIETSFITGTGAIPKKVVIIKDFVATIDSGSNVAVRDWYDITNSDIQITSNADATLGDGTIKVKMWTTIRTFG